MLSGRFGVTEVGDAELGLAVAIGVAGATVGDAAAQAASTAASISEINMLKRFMFSPSRKVGWARASRHAAGHHIKHVILPARGMNPSLL
jgi:hypothetical protein